VPEAPRPRGRLQRKRRWRPGRRAQGLRARRWQSRTGRAGSSQAQEPAPVERGTAGEARLGEARQLPPRRRCRAPPMPHARCLRRRVRAPHGSEKGGFRSEESHLLGGGFREGPPPPLRQKLDSLHCGGGALGNAILFVCVCVCVLKERESETGRERAASGQTCPGEEIHDIVLSTVHVMSFD